MRVGRAVAVGAAVVVVGGGAALVALRVANAPSVPARTLPAAPAGRVESRNGDCGWTAPLGDGKVLWVVCDPTALPGGLTNSVAVADPAERTPDLQDANFVPPNPTDQGRCSEHGGAASWINGVTTAPGPEHGSTLVTAFFIHGCRQYLLDGTEAGDYGVATFTYRQGSRPTATDPFRAFVRRWDLFPGRWSSGERVVPFGAGAVFHDGFHYVYGCHPDETPDWDNEGQCSIARSARLADVGSREVWAFWQGPDQGWHACRRDQVDHQCSEASFRAVVDAAAPLDLPLPGIETPAGFTPQQFSVSWSPQLDAFVSAAPRAFGDPTLRIRVARAAEGPWSPPGDVAVDCDPLAVEAGFNCYHLAPHPELTEPGGDAQLRLLFAFHDAGNESGSDLALVAVPTCEVAALADLPCPAAD